MNRILMVSAAALILGMASPAFAGDSNTSYVEQLNGATNGQATVDQTAAGGTTNHSEIYQGYNWGGSDQNVAETTQSGLGTSNTSYTYQDGTSNTARVTQTGDGVFNTSSVNQAGSSNTATVNQGLATSAPGLVNNSTVYQYGNSNTATVNQR